ncbi:MAG: ROK family protein [Candidatus Ratteibacteria bacterium]
MVSKILFYRKNILKEIYEKDGISRKELHELLDIRFATITQIVRSFINEGIIEEVGKKKKGKGRPHLLLKIVPDSKFFVGCELTPKKIISVILNFKGKIVGSGELDIKSNDDKNEILKKIVDLIKYVIERNKIEKKKIWGIGFVDPGIIDIEKGISIFSSILPQWKDVETTRYIEKNLGIKTFIIGTSQVKVLSEKFFGKGKRSKNFIFIELGEGVGCGIMNEGKIIHGVGGVAGEFGHIKIYGRKELCSCGGIGCLEAIVSIPSIEKRVEIIKGERLRINDIVDKYEENSEIKNIIDDVIDVFSLSISNLINILNPELVIFDKNFQFFEKLLDKIIEKIKNNMVYNYPVKFEISDFDENIGAIGGACFSISKFLQLDI